MPKKKNNSGRKKLPIGEKAVLVGFYTKKENVDRLGGMARTRFKAKQYIESFPMDAPI